MFRRAFSTLLPVLLLAAGCAVGPNFKKPSAPSAASYSPEPLPKPVVPAEANGGGSQHFVSGKDISGDWWTAFECPELNTLVAKALRANPTIAAAKAALRQAQELTYAQQGAYFPQVEAGYSFERQQLAGNLGGNSPGLQGNGSVIQTFQNPGGTPANGPVTFNFHTAQVTVGYVVDVFGENRRQVESLDAQAAMQRFELDAAYTTLASSVVAAVIQEAATRAQIAATKKMIADNIQMLDVLRNQFSLGYASTLDLAAQESALAQIQQTLPPLQKQLEQTRDLLRALAGNLPGQELTETFELSSLHLPQDLPLSLPSAIIRQRPDVRAAEEQMRSANAQVGAALANMLPQFTVSGTAGGAASKFTQMFYTGGPFWSLAGSASQPLFEGGTLLHRKRAASQALAQATAQYQGAVISAYQNVADTLHALVSDAGSVEAALAFETAAGKTLGVTQQQLESGYANQLALLNADQAYQQAVLQRVQAQAGRYADTAALFQALGGGWWNCPALTKN